MKRQRVLTVAAIGLLTVFAIGGYAAAGSGKDHVQADAMTGYSEGAVGGPVSSPASGSFEATIDDAAQEIQFTLSYSGLEGDVRQAHIHFGQRSVNAGISIWLCETAATEANRIAAGSPDVPTCPQSGTVESTVGVNHVIGPAAQGIAPGEFAEIVRAIRAGRAYANVHTTKFPGGEIRGQINDQNQRDD
ncbi:MAG TPA: CHRD domain-containing protein [Gaiellaceae bacterium]|nr:CHRD domain-containing protein [Gaiellaceae bacterium]